MAFLEKKLKFSAKLILLLISFLLTNAYHSDIAYGRTVITKRVLHPLPCVKASIADAVIEFKNKKHIHNFYKRLELLMINVLKQGNHQSAYMLFDIADFFQNFNKPDNYLPERVINSITSLFLLSRKSFENNRVKIRSKKKIARLKALSQIIKLSPDGTQVILKHPKKNIAWTLGIANNNDEGEGEGEIYTVTRNDKSVYEGNIKLEKSTFPKAKVNRVYHLLKQLLSHVQQNDPFAMFAIDNIIEFVFTKKTLKEQTLTYICSNIIMAENIEKESTTIHKFLMDKTTQKIIRALIHLSHPHQRKDLINLKDLKIIDLPL